MKVGGVSTDTRKVKKGELFIAIKGDTFDGNNFTDQAVQSGAVALVVSRADVAGIDQVAVILVKDTTKALGHLAAFHRRRFKIPVVAITGSAGKTTTKEFTASVLSAKFKVLYNAGTENNHIGVPMTMLRMAKNDKAAVLELGTNHFGEIAWLASIVQPTVAVFTNIGASHLAGLGSPEGVLKEKRTLVNFLAKDGTIILNADDPLLRTIRKKKSTQKLLTYGIDRKADVKASSVVAEKEGLLVTLGKDEDFRLQTPVWGNIYNALAAIACGKVFKIKFALIKKALQKTGPAKGRQCFYQAGGVTVVDDTYNANPVSYRNALRTLSLMPRQGRSFVIAADMLELGENCEALHAGIGDVAAKSGVDKLWSVGRWAGLIGERACAVNASVEARHFKDKEALVSTLLRDVRKGDIVLVKGSRGMKMESVVERLLDLLKKGA